MEATLQLLTGAIAIGCVYSLIAIAFTMMLRATDIINFAQGDLVMLGAYIGYTIGTETGLPFAAVFVITVILTFVLGPLMDRVIFRPILSRGSPVLNLIIATIGISVVLEALVVIIWGGVSLPMPNSSFGTVHIGGISLSGTALIVIGFSIVTMGALHWFFKRTMSGLSWRAVANDREAAELMGVNSKRVISLTFGIVSAMGGAAGVLIAPLFNVSVDLAQIAIKGFAGAAIGGFGVIGSMAGGVILGILETGAARYVSSSYSDVVAYGLMILILLVFFRPRVPAGTSPSERARAIVGTQRARHSRHHSFVIYTAISVVALLVPLVVTGSFALRILAQSLVFVIGAIGLQLIIGYTGQFSLGHAAFMGLGAYVSVRLTQAGVPWLVTLLAAMIAAALLAAIVTPLLRLRGHYLAIGTLALGQILVILFTNVTPLTNGSFGLSGILPPSIFGYVIQSERQYFYLFLAMAAVTLFLIYRILHSRFGKSLVAIRENERASIGCGINVLRQQSMAFAIGCACAGLSGALYAPFVSVINPTAFTFTVSISFLIMVVIGGLGSMPGAVVGAIVVNTAPEYMRFLGDWRLVVFGVIIIVFMVLLPGGLVDLARLPARLGGSRILQLRLPTRKPKTGLWAPRRWATRWSGSDGIDRGHEEAGQSTRDSADGTPL